MTIDLDKIQKVIDSGPYDAEWISLQKYQIPEWYANSKFGIFIHWGIYSVPAFGNEWYARNMYIKDSPEFLHHKKTYGNHDVFGYKDFIPLFSGTDFNPLAWASTISNSGAQYVIPVAEHHDGFQMYKSSLSKWNAFEMGPKRDILGELKTALEEKKLVFGASSHRIEHWSFMNSGKKIKSDIPDKVSREDIYWPSEDEKEHYDIYSSPPPSQEFLDDWLLRTCELISFYHPRILYFDWWIQHECVKPYLKKIAAFYYNSAKEWEQEVVINYKHDAFMFGTAVVDVERGHFAECKPFIWQTDTSIATNSWCYTENNNYKSSNELLCTLIDVVSKNGRLLLNIGPKSNGLISKEETKVLEEIGNWLNINGEAIYDSGVWRVFGEGPTKISEGNFTEKNSVSYTIKDIRYTFKEIYIYAFILNPANETCFLLRSLPKSTESNHGAFTGVIKSIDLLCSDENVSWTQKENGLKINIEKNNYDCPIVFRIELK